MNIESTIQKINVDLIIPNRFQPRLAFDENALNELANSIKEHGIIQPLVLRRVEDKYEIIAGERRYKAAQLAGLTEVPAIITDIDDQKSAEVALVENVQRKNLNSMEEARSYKKILDKGYITQEALAQKMGISQSTLANKLRLLNLSPEVQEALINNKISERHARSLLLVDDKLRQVALLNRIIAERLTVRQLDSIIKDNPAMDEPKIEEPVSDRPSASSLIDNEEFLMPSVNEVKEETENDALELPQSVAVPEQPETVQTDIKEEPIDTLETLDDDIIKDDNPLEKILDRITGPKYPSLEDEATNLNIDNNEFFNPFNNMEDEPLPIVETPEEKEVEEQAGELLEQTENPLPEVEQAVSKIEANNFESVRDAYDNLKKEVEAAGFKVTAEDFDFEDIYQIIIKIDKQPED